MSSEMLETGADASGRLEQAAETPAERRRRQRREANARWRALPGNRERQLAMQAKWRTAPENREKQAARRADPEYREKQAARRADPEYREKLKAAAVRYRSTPEGRKASNEASKRSRAKKRAAALQEGASE